MDGAVAEVPEPDDEEVHPVLRAALVAAVALAIAGFAQAATPDSVKLANALKANMTSLYKKKAPDHAITKGTCVLPAMATVGHCKAYFTIVSQQAKGFYSVTASIDRTTGGVRWKETKVTCVDSKTGAQVIGC